MSGLASIPLPELTKEQFLNKASGAHVVQTSSENVHYSTQPKGNANPIRQLDGDLLTINKTTILKYSTVTLLLCASSFTAGLYFPYVILTVPTVFFAISIVVALTAAVYLISSIISALNDKKKVDLSEKEFGEPGKQQEFTALQEEQQKGFEYNNDTNNKPGCDEVDSRKESKSTPTSFQSTTGTAQNTSSSTLPPPPPPPTQQGADAPPPPPLPLSVTKPGNGNERVSLLDSIRKADGRPKKKGQNSSSGAGSNQVTQNKGAGGPPPLPQSDSKSNSTNVPSTNDILAGRQNLKKTIPAKQPVDSATRVEGTKDPRINSLINSKAFQNDLVNTVKGRSKATHGSDSESEYSSSNSESGWNSDESTQKQKVLTKHKRKTSSLDSKSEHKPAPPPKPITKVSGMSQVSSETQNPSTFSIKDCAKQWGT